MVAKKSLLLIEVLHLLGIGPKVFGVLQIGVTQDLLNQLVLYCLLTVACNIAVAVLHSLLDGTSEQYSAAGPVGH